MTIPRSPRDLLPSGPRLGGLVVLFGLFCVVVPVEVAADLLQRGEPADLFRAALLAGTALVSGGLALAVTRLLDRLTDEAPRSG